MQYLLGLNIYILSVTFSPVPLHAERSEKKTHQLSILVEEFSANRTQKLENSRPIYYNTRAHIQLSIWFSPVAKHTCVDSLLSLSLSLSLSDKLDKWLYIPSPILLSIPIFRGKSISCVCIHTHIYMYIYASGAWKGSFISLDIDFALRPSV